MPSKPATSKPSSTKAHSGSYDWGLLTIVATLLTLGVIMVFSASYTIGIYVFDDPLYYFIRQLMWLGVGTVAMIVTMRIPYTLWQRWSVLLMIGAFLALTAVIVLGVEILGSTRTLFSGSIQPAEPAQIIIIVYVSAWLASKGERIRNVQVGLLPFAVLMGIVTLLLVAQPKISTAVLIVATASIMFFIAGAELRQLLVVGLGGSATFWLIIHYSAYAGPRIERYLQGISNPLESQEWQATRTLRAIVNGGIFGQGLGGSDYKLPGGVPLGWSDNIFAIIGEELGLLGTLLVIFLFCLLVYRGLRTALRAPDTFGMLLATGITSLLALQALLNAGVALAIAPATGITLPFISYGGSSLLTVMAAVGILLSISREATAASPISTDPQTAYARFNFGWGNGGTRLPRASRSVTTGPSGTNSRSAGQPVRPRNSSRSSHRT
ncbi:MAG: FtsW/RodA/SpoVE family cell cycle protein [Caldilineaceae bacterium]|nr:FtsW/RodA/SpoVE family cell cycle protein [Caldilineaceae bacterium]